eukprot:1161450-Pelagomonas_calceolata.AAC.5
MMHGHGYFMEQARLHQRGPGCKEAFRNLGPSKSQMHIGKYNEVEDQANSRPSGINMLCIVRLASKIATYRSSTLKTVMLAAAAAAATDAVALAGSTTFKDLGSEVRALPGWLLFCQPQRCAHRDRRAAKQRRIFALAQTQGAASTEAPRLAGRKLLVSEGGTTTCVHCMPMAVLKRKEKKQEAANVYRAGEKRNDAGGRERRWRVRTT